MSRFFKSILIAILAFGQFFYVFSASAQTSGFNFIAWGDTKSDLNTLQALSIQARTLTPVLTIYAGDLEADGFTTVGMNAWKNAMNGGTNNGMFERTFPTRGNHDDHLLGSSTNWQNYFNLSSHVQNIGGTNYSALNDDLSYSFDYGNSRFVGLDATGNVTKLTAAQIAWLDQRLTDAENRGLTHVFLFWHGPIYSVANHCCPVPSPDLINVINRHPIVSATFHGHEHVLTYNHLNSAKVPGLTRDLEQFISGDAGAGPTTPTTGKTDYWLNVGSSGGYMAVTVSGSAYRVDMYKGGSTAVQFTKTFTKSGSPTETQVTPSRTPTQPTISPTQTFISPTPTSGVCTYYKN